MPFFETFSHDRFDIQNRDAVIQRVAGEVAHVLEQAAEELLRAGWSAPKTREVLESATEFALAHGDIPGEQQASESTAALEQALDACRGCADHVYPHATCPHCVNNGAVVDRCLNAVRAAAR